MAHLCNILYRFPLVRSCVNVDASFFVGLFIGGGGGGGSDDDGSSNNPDQSSRCRSGGHKQPSSSSLLVALEPDLY